MNLFITQPNNLILVVKRGKIKLFTFIILKEVLFFFSLVLKVALSGWLQPNPI
jgi:hypothetical protein